MERKSNVDRLPMHFTSGLNGGSAKSERQGHGGAEGIRQPARKPALLADVRSLIRREQPDQTISRLARQVEARERFIEEQRAYIGHGRRILEKASAADGIGIWECELPTETLYWSGGTYDLFGVPRGARVTRTDTLRSYTEKSLASLQAARGQAIADLTGFELDAEIETPIGNHRWIRSTATVESENGRAARIFGLKRDITEEKRKWEAARYLAEVDP